MTWQFDPSSWANGVTIPQKSDFVSIRTDLRTRGGNVDGAGYGRSNSRFLTMTPGALPGTSYTVTGAAWASNVAMLTIGAHVIKVGQRVAIAGATPSGYNNADAVITAIASTTISYALLSNPGSWTSGGTVVVDRITPAEGMVATDSNGILLLYRNGEWVSAVPRGLVMMTHNASGDWTVYTPFGSALDVTGTTTEGLQEAIAYACTNNFNLRVEGGDGGSPSLLNCSTAIAFPAMQNKFIEINGVTLNFTYTTSAPSVTFDSMMMMRVEFDGTQIVNNGTGPAVLFKPTNALPVDGRTTITISYVYITTAVNIHSPASAVAAVPLIDFDTTNGGVDDNLLEFDEVNASGIGIRVQDPASGKSFSGNDLFGYYVHGQTGTSGPSVQLGTSTAAATRVVKNTLRFFVGVGVAAKRGVDIWGSQNKGFISVDPSVGSTGHALWFGTTADFNRIESTQLSGAAGPTNFLSIGGTANRNCVEISTTKTMVSITVGASPFTYPNADFVEEDVMITGTMTAIDITPDGVAFAPTPAAGGTYHLVPGMGVRIAYSGATPTMWKIL